MRDRDTNRSLLPDVHEQLLRERALLRAVVETAVDVIVTIDEGGRILSANSAVQRVFGHEPEGLIGQNVTVLMPEPYRSEHDQYLRNFIETGEAKIIGIGRDMHGMRADGSTFPMYLAVSETITEEGRIFTGIIRDITERKRAEMALRKEKGLLKAVVDTAVDGIITIAEDGTILTANPAVNHIFGYAEEELAGRNVTVLMPAPYREEHDGYLRYYLRTGEKRIIGIGREVQGRRKDGSTFPLELGVSETRTEEGLIFTGVLRDISERKAAEEEILALNNDLERRVQERTEELEDLVAELQGFTHSIAHDLRSPLRSINGYARILDEDYGERLGDEGREYLDLIANGAIRIGNLMDALLAHARIGRRQFERIRLNLSEMAEAIAATYPEGQFDIEPDLAVDGDPDMVRILLENLINNACKYVQPNQRPIVSIKRDHNAIVVRDRGIGFDARYSDKLFEPFQRLHSDREFPGTGIGLANVRRIVNKHGGRVWAESQPGEGSAFFFTLG